MIMRHTVGTYITNFFDNKLKFIRNKNIMNANRNLEEKVF